jgi:hypothetical protein
VTLVQRRKGSKGSLKNTFQKKCNVVTEKSNLKKAKSDDEKL